MSYVMQRLHRRTCTHIAARGRQQGFSLFIVLIILLLSLLLALGGSRVANLLEAMTGTRREYDRAYEAAEAALIDAQRDIEGLAYSSTTKSYVSCDTIVPAADSKLCRKLAGVRGYPDLETNGLAAYTMDSCQDGICVFEDPTSQRIANAPATKFWASNAYKNAGATYGQFTGAPTAAEGNESLANTRYWIEVIKRSDETLNGQYVYRITAMSNGTRGEAGATSVVLQMSYDPDPIILKAPTPPCAAEPCPPASGTASPPPPAPAPAPAPAVG